MARRLTFPFLLILLFAACLPASAGIRISDDSGRTVVLEQAARRVVSLYAGHSENLLALGAGDAIVGVSASDDPALFPGVTVLPMRADGERILALAPDLVLLRPQGEAAVEGVIRLLERGGVPVVSLSPPTWETMEAYLVRLGALVGVTDPERPWREKVAALERSVPAGKRPRVFLESSSRGLMTCSPSSWAARVIALAGGENAASDAVPLRPGSPLAPWGEERLLALAGEGIDVYLVQVGAMNPVTERDIPERPWISGLGNARVVLVPEECVSRPSLLRLEEGVEWLRNVLYPEGGNSP